MGDNALYNVCYMMVDTCILVIVYSLERLAALNLFYHLVLLLERWIALQAFENRWIVFDIVSDLLQAFAKLVWHFLMVNLDNSL